MLAEDTQEGVLAHHLAGQALEPELGGVAGQGAGSGVGVPDAEELVGLVLREQPLGEHRALVRRDGEHGPGGAVDPEARDDVPFPGGDGGDVR